MGKSVCRGCGHDLAVPGSMTILWWFHCSGHQSFGGVNSSKERGNYVIAFHVWQCRQHTTRPSELGRWGGMTLRWVTRRSWDDWIQRGTVVQEDGRVEILPIQLNGWLSLSVTLSFLIHDMGWCIYFRKQMVSLFLKSFKWVLCRRAQGVAHTMHWINVSLYADGGPLPSTGETGQQGGRSGKTPLSWGHIKLEVIFEIYKKIRVGNKQKWKGWDWRMFKKWQMTYKKKGMSRFLIFKDTAMFRSESRPSYTQRLVQGCWEQTRPPASKCSLPSQIYSWIIKVNISRSESL